MPQIKRKRDYVDKNRTKFLDVLGLAGEMKFSEFKIIPFVFINHPFCVGFTIDEIPIVDKYILGRYFEPGEYEMFVQFDQSGEKEVGKKIIFYNSPEDAEEKIESYLFNPPQLELFKKFISKRYFPIPMLDDTDRKAVYVTLDVILPMPSKDNR